ncbi:MAG: hypothetical protein PHC66_00295 [Candidatus Nanoarchaeia archaeon]|nr:hypothetical protein [Candidatus Nanoarchaeia archaeon]MDD5239611.1 hypothetical protein [Candidatus Nanoarchaeia archaeon]
MNETEPRYGLLSGNCDECYTCSRLKRSDLETQLDEAFPKPNFFVKKISAYVRTVNDLLIEKIHSAETKAERAPYKMLANLHADEILIKEPESELSKTVGHWKDLCKIGNCYRARIWLAEKKQ